MSSEFIHDPEGVLIFDEPTELRVQSGSAESSASVTVLPYSKLSGETVWSGPDTYIIPDNAEYTKVGNLALDGRKASFADMSDDDDGMVDLGEHIQ